MAPSDRAALNPRFIIRDDDICVIWIIAVESVTKYDRRNRVLAHKHNVYITMYNLVFRAVQPSDQTHDRIKTFKIGKEYHVYNDDLHSKWYSTHVYDVCLRFTMSMASMTEGFLLLSCCIRTWRSLSTNISKVSTWMEARAASYLVKTKCKSILRSKWEVLTLCFVTDC